MSDADKLRDANPWHPITNAVDLKHLGKLAEELTVCITVAAFCLVYGVSDHEPTPMTATRTWLGQEIADVRANIELVADRFDLKARRLYEAEASLQSVLLLLLAETDIDYLSELVRRLAECGSAVSRCIIQGVDECEPVTGRSNRAWLRESASAASQMIDMIITRFHLDETAIRSRAAKKMAHLRQWHALA